MDKQSIIVAVVVAVIGSQALGAIVNGMIAAAKERKKKPTNMEEAVRWLLQDRLEHVMEREIQNGRTKRLTKAQVHKGYEIYHALGGNGDMAAMMKDYDELEVEY